MPDRSKMTYLGVAPVTVDERSGEATFKRSDIRYSPEFGGFAGTPSREAILNTGAAWGNYSGSAAATEEWWQGAAGSEPWGVSPYAMHDGSFGDLPGYDADDPYAESLGMDLVDNDFGMDLVDNDFGDDDMTISEELLEGELAGFGDWYPSQNSTADLPWSEGAYATQDGGTSFGEYELETADWAEGMVNMHSTGSEPWDHGVGNPGNNPSFGANKAPKILTPRQAKATLGNNLRGKLTSTSTKNIATVAVPVGAARDMRRTSRRAAARVFKKAGLFPNIRAARQATRNAQAVRKKSGQRPLQIPGPPGPLFLLPIPLQIMIVRIPKTNAQSTNSSGSTGAPAPKDHAVASPGGGSAQPGIVQASPVHGSLALWKGRATDALAAADAAHQSWAAQGITVRSPYAVYDMGGGGWEVEGTVQTQGGIDAPVVWDESLFQGTPSEEAIRNTGAAWGNYSGYDDEYDDEY